ncbi:hypothetical protein L484_007316 [Morus notabilis]|uniref:Knottin scorpion toxin-like domain-containing protein n=1 Tax=Morus notabilis TaxID=981085 RepID=W9RMJ1_9ROSA|nr:hypothetical protein L484_007316 [Morus notabilis]
MKKKVSFTLSPLLLLLFLLFSVEFTLTSAVVSGTRAVRIPEHTCHKQIVLTGCNQQNCTRECSKEPYGFGACKDGVCFCTFYCKDPPV